MRCYYQFLLLEIFWRHFFCITSLSLCIFLYLWIYLKKLATQTFNLFLCSWPNISRCYNSSHTLSCSYSLQTCHTYSHNKSFGWSNCTCCRHHHWKGSSHLNTGLKHSLVARQITLRRQHIHRLRSGYPWQQF